jgi:hypothetical protein
LDAGLAGGDRQCNARLGGDERERKAEEIKRRAHGSGEWGLARLDPGEPGACATPLAPQLGPPHCREEACGDLGLVGELRLLAGGRQPMREARPTVSVPHVNRSL